HRASAPGDKDPRKPLPSAPSLDQQCARNLQQKVPRKEDPRRPAKGPIGKPQRCLHAVLRKPNVHPVEIRNDVKDKDERKQTPRNLAVDTSWIHVEIRRTGGASDGHKASRVRRGSTACEGLYETQLATVANASVSTHRSADASNPFDGANNLSRNCKSI